jgi:hypothetical protein
MSFVFKVTARDQENPDISAEWICGDPFGLNLFTEEQALISGKKLGGKLLSGMPHGVMLEIQPVERLSYVELETQILRWWIDQWDI